MYYYSIFTKIKIQTKSKIANFIFLGKAIIVGKHFLVNVLSKLQTN